MEIAGEMTLMYSKPSSVVSGSSGQMAKMLDICFRVECFVSLGILIFVGWLRVG